MQEFGRLKTIPYSFFSAECYRYVRVNWEGLGFSYLFIINLILFTPAVLIAIIAFDTLLIQKDQSGTSPISEFIYTIIDQVPEIVIEDGTMTTEFDEPYHLYAHIDGEELLFATIDPDADISAFLMEGSTTTKGLEEDMFDEGKEGVPWILVTKDAIVTQRMDGESTIRTWDEVTEGEEYVLLNAEIVRNIVEEGFVWFDDNKIALYGMIGFFLWVAIMLFMFLVRIIQVLMFSLIGLIITSMFNMDMPFDAIARLTAVALTPGILLNAVFMLTGGGLPTFVFVFMTCGYLYFAIHVNKAIDAPKNN